eukprot:13269071-Ditylum_brightwellii.AAC.1
MGDGDVGAGSAAGTEGVIFSFDGVVVFCSFSIAGFISSLSGGMMWGSGGLSQLSSGLSVTLVALRAG